MIIGGAGPAGNEISALSCDSGEPSAAAVVAEGSVCAFVVADDRALLLGAVFDGSVDVVAGCACAVADVDDGCAAGVVGGA
jgi:hypothetical protein